MYMPKGVHRASVKMRDGRIKQYFYAWRGGPAITEKPGTHKFTDAVIEAYASALKKKEADSNCFSSIIDAYLQSVDFKRLAPTTKREYAKYSSSIIAEFGAVKVSAFENKEIRARVIAWRDGISATPCAADYSLRVLSRIVSFGVDRGLISQNFLSRIKKIYNNDRSDLIWTPGDIAQFDNCAPPHLIAAMQLALWTAQRQGDLLNLKWSSYDGKYIRLRQNKAKRGNIVGKIITIPVASPLRLLLEELREKNEARQVPHEYILCSKNGRWTIDGFQSSWRNAMKRANLPSEGLTFHDLRGTAITRLAQAGCTVTQIASISGHQYQSVHSILERYVSRTVDQAEMAITALQEAYFKDSAV